ncbi:MAG: hypothetical protein HY907_09560 [Deltaproteobacteria bacterium]|nr:hypothetical protein [Deltaproteobacteria bacterium]
MKPMKKDPDPARARAAREKIASDLACDLKLTVPPVVLAHRENAGAEESDVCVSLVMYPVQYSWYTVEPKIREIGDQVAGAARTAMWRTAALALAFDTWVGQGDHHNHPHNIVFGYVPGDLLHAEFVFLDYAWAFGFSGGWRGEGTSTCGPVGFPTIMLANMDRPALLAAVAAIEQFDVATIKDVVARIPTSHLDRQEGQLIASRLIQRRSSVRAALSMQMSGGGS